MLHFLSDVNSQGTGDGYREQGAIGRWTAVYGEELRGVRLFGAALSFIKQFLSKETKRLVSLKVLAWMRRSA